jgi:catechol 2,3-dioxygenase-like lactoylglutathione lyase family enzyme
MNIHHVALWTMRLEEMKDFYVQHFDCVAGPRYVNAAKGFSSYFLRFESGACIELMMKEGISPAPVQRERIGYAHIAISVGSETAVREKTEAFRATAVPIIGEPRWTGDGYFESVVADPDGNPVEITI